MSIRTFVTVTSVILMAWLVTAFIYTPAVGGGSTPATSEATPASLQEAEEPVDLTVSVSQ